MASTVTRRAAALRAALAAALPAALPATLLATLLALSACGGGEPSAPPDASASPDPSASAAASATPEPSQATIRLGLSDPIDGEGWHEAMACSAAAQARADGKVERLAIAQRDTDSAGQAADIASLVDTGVDALVVYPSDVAAIGPAIEVAIAEGVVVVTVGRSLDIDGAYAVVTDQDAVGFLGGDWLLETMGGKGGLVILRGTEDDPIDTARLAGLRRALEAYPDVEIVAEPFTEGDPIVAVERINTILEAGDAFDGIWTSDVDSVVVDALRFADTAYVPIVGRDDFAFVSQLLEEDGLDGAAVTDTAALGGAAVTLALRVLAGDPPAEPRVVIAPQLWENTTDAGRATLEAALDPSLDPTWPLRTTIDGWTTYDTDDLVACLGPDDAG